MKVLQMGTGVFPMEVRCEQIKDEYGFCYGNKVDFCGSLLEIDAEDICSHKWEKYPDMSGTDYGIICPVCGNFIMIPAKNIPERVKKCAPAIRIN